MIIVCIRTFIMYMLVLLVLRIMGKSELSNLSTFQMVVLFMIAELASLPIDTPTASLANGVISIFTLLVLQVSFSFFSMKNERFKNFVNGKPSIIIEQGKINVQEMRRLRITIDDLFEQLRIEDCPSLNDVQYAVMESNGELSIIQKRDAEGLPLIIISDGILHETNLNRSGLSKKKLLNLLQQKGLSSIKDVFVAFFDEENKLHIYPLPENHCPFAKEVM